MAQGKHISDNRDIIELIEDYAYTLEYPPNLPSAYDYNNMWLMLDARDEIHRRGLDKDERVKEIDKRMLEGLKEFGTLIVYRYDNSNKPLAYWWWHLDKIARREYPEELLPEYLRDLYKNFLNNS